MGSIINEKTYSLNNQMASGSRSSLLISHVDFKRNEEEDDIMSAKSLQNKYNVLSNDTKLCVNNELNVKMNGQSKNNSINSNINHIMNGQIVDNNLNDGIAVPKYVLYPREKVQLEWKETQKIGAGLANLGNTCFLNSVLQCLTYCPPLVNYLLYNSDDEHSSKCNVGFCMTCEMAKHIKLAHNHCGDTIKPIYICRRLKSIAKHFTFGRQEDAHEFLRYVIDNMWRSCLSIHEFNNNFKLDPLSKETTAINQIFGGYHRSQVICFQCKEKSNTYDYFMDFMLDIKNVSSLEKALDKFVAPEILQNDNAYKCPRCKRKVLAKKQFTVFRAPNVATFQLKRFDYNRIFGGKITKLISYPEKLNLRPYMSENRGPPVYYKLNSVLVHLGPTCNSGHYFCFVRNSSGYWYLMDDSRIAQVSLNQVLNQQAYVLFYVRVDTDFHKPNPVKNFISHTTPHGVKLTSVSSPEMAFRHQKFNNNYSLHNGNFSSHTTKLNSSTISPKMITCDGIKHPQSLNKQKQKNLESSNLSIKGLVPYASDSSDEESYKQMSNSNGSVDCDKDKNRKLSTGNHKSSVDEMEHNSSNTEKLDNSSHKNNSISSQNIPNFRINLNNNHNNSNSTEPMSCAPLAPITLKVKATTSSWHVVETALRSPSVASGSSTNSVNSTTEWTISECLPECNSNQHSKHHSHHKHRNKQNRCASITNGNVKQVISTKNKIPHHLQDIDEAQYEPKSTSEQSDNAFQTQDLKNQLFSDSRLFNVNKNELKSDNENSNINTNQSKSKDNHLMDSVNERDQSDRRSVSSHRNSNDFEGSRETNNRVKETERNHIKSYNNSINSSDDSSTTSSHSYEKKKYRKHKLKISHSRKTSVCDSDSNDDNNAIKLKHKKKKKKQKKKKHRRRSSSDSESNASSDNQLQWIERTKETVEKERNSSVSKDSFTKQWDENVRDLANKKRKLDEDLSHKCFNTGNGEVLNGLLKTSFRGYGDKVNSWEGGPSHLNVSLDEDNRYNHNGNDEYNDEFDCGKNKKVKIHRTEYPSYGSKHNPFQKFQSNKHRNNGAFDYRNKHHFDKSFKHKHNNHKSWKSDHNRYDNDRRH